MSLLSRERNEDNSTELSLFLRSLINLSLDKLSHLLPSSNIHPKDYLTIIHRLSNVPNNYITIEGRSKLTFPFVPVLTEYGFCSTFNSRPWTHSPGSTSWQVRKILTSQCSRPSTPKESLWEQYCHWTKRPPWTFTTTVPWAFPTPCREWQWQISPLSLPIFDSRVMT